MAVLVGGVVGFGLADHALTSAGYGTLGMFVWGGGYLATMFVVWYGWVRHIDMTGI